MPSTIKIKLETTRILEIIVNSIASDLYFKIDFVDIKFTIDNINPAPLKIKHRNPSNSNNTLIITTPRPIPNDPAKPATMELVSIFATFSLAFIFAIKKFTSKPKHKIPIVINMMAIIKMTCCFFDN